MPKNSLIRLQTRGISTITTPAPARPVTQLFSKAWHITLYVLLISLLLTLLLQLMFLALPSYDAEIQQYLNDSSDYQIEFSHSSNRWAPFGPEITVSDIKVSNKHGKHIVDIDKITVHISIFNWLLRQQITFSSISISGATVELNKTDDNHWQLNGHELSSDGASSQFKLNDLGDIKLENIALVVQETPGQQGTKRLLFNGKASPAPFGKIKIQGEAILSRPYGGTIELIAEISSPNRGSKFPSATLFLQTRGLMLDSLPANLLGNFHTLHGSLNSNIWVRWKNRRIESFKGTFDAHQLYASDTTQTSELFQQINLLAGDFDFQWQAEPFRGDITFHRLMAIIDEQPIVLPELIQFSYGHTPFKELTRYNLSFNTLDLKNCRSLLNRFSPYLPEKVTQFSTIDIDGKVSEANLIMVYHKGERRITDLDLQARLENLSIPATKKAPGISTLNAQVFTRNQQLHLHLEANQSQLLWPEQFSQPIEIDQLTAEVVIAQPNDATLITVQQLNLKNSDLTLTGSASLTLSDNEKQSSSLNLALKLPYIDLKQLRHYLPKKATPPLTKRWLTQAFSSGIALDGEINYHGELGRFPENGDKENQFHVAINAQGVDLSYHPDWPVIRDINGQVTVNNRQLVILADTAQLHGNQITQTEVAIARLGKDSTLTVDGTVNGKYQNYLAYLKQSPLRKNLGGLIKSTEQASGKATLTLALKIPLGRKKKTPVPTVCNEENSTASDCTTAPSITAEEAQTSKPKATVEGKLQLHGLAMTQWQVEIANLQGAVLFNEREVSSQALTGNIWGYATELAITRAETAIKTDAKVVIAFEGSYPLSEVWQRYVPKIQPYVQGSAHLKGSLVIPHSQSNQPPMLNLTSMLKGVSSTLPAPLNKLSQQQKLAELTLTFPSPQTSTVQIEYQNQIFADIAILPPSDSSLRPEYRYQITALADELDVTPWLQLISEHNRPSTNHNARVKVAHNWRATIDVSANNLRANSIALGEATVNIVSSPTEGEIQLKNSLATGSIHWKNSSSNKQPLDVQLDFLHLDPLLNDINFTQESSSDTNSPEETIKPSDFPAINLSIKRLHRNQKLLGNLTAVMAQTDNQLRINNGQLKSNNDDVKFDGFWKHHLDQDTTMLNINWVSKNFGQTLPLLGYSKAIKHGKGWAKATFQWGASPHHYQAALLNGEVSVDIRKGKLITVEPGIGRVVGLLNVDLLQRRLLLDFGDVVSSGFDFQKISGGYQITSGNAVTNNLHIDGPAATIAISGRVGLAQKDQQQKITVTPKISGGLAVAGAVTAGPVGAAAGYLVQKTIGKSLEKISRVSYTLSGTWDKPIIKNNNK